MIRNVLPLAICCFFILPTAGEGVRVISASPKDSLLEVRNRVRSLRQQDASMRIEVHLKPGRYVMQSPLSFTGDDSGVFGRPVVWKGSATGKTTLTVGCDIPPKLFRPVNGRAGVFMADLSSWRISWPELPNREYMDPMPIPEVFVNGKRFLHAGWPDWPTVAEPDDALKGWTTIAAFVDSGTRANTGVVFDASKKPEHTVPRGGTFRYSGSRPERWVGEKNLYLHGFWCFDWSDTKIAVDSINLSSNTITLAHQHEYGIRQGNPSPRRWRACNVFAELDRYGECYVDTGRSRVYVCMPAPPGRGDKITVTWRDMPVMSLNGVSNMVISDMELMGSWKDAVHGFGLTNVVLNNLSIHAARLRGVDIRASEKVRLSRCEIFDVGLGGILLEGGDRKILRQSGNVVEDCLIRTFSVNRLTSAYAIVAEGCGNVMRHNEIFDAPHQAVLFVGNDMLFEFNVISNVLQCTDDAGALYTGRNPSCRGNVVRYCLFSDIGSDRGQGNAAIYFDDGDGGNLVEGCIFDRCGAPGRYGFGTVFSNGGYSNVVRDCLFIDCERPLGSAPWDEGAWKVFLNEGYIKDRIKRQVDIESDAYVARYPELRGILCSGYDFGQKNLAEGNVFVNSREIMCGNWVTNGAATVTYRLPRNGRVDACRRRFRCPKSIPCGEIGRRTERNLAK